MKQRGKAEVGREPFPNTRGSTSLWKQDALESGVTTRTPVWGRAVGVVSRF